jgi:hypothetical protein
MFPKLAKAFAIVGSITALAGASTAGAQAQPDFSGVWLPDILDQIRQETENMPPWKPEILRQVQHLVDEEKAGRLFLVLSHCLPHGMPSWMLMTHNAFEWLATPALCSARSTATGCGGSIRMAANIRRIPI